MRARAPVSWSTLPVAHQTRLITLLAQLAQRQLLKSTTKEGTGDERRDLTLPFGLPTDRKDQPQTPR